MLQNQHFTAAHNDLQVYLSITNEYNMSNEDNGLIRTKTLNINT